jgi:hypothetical protein
MGEKKDSPHYIHKRNEGFLLLILVFSLLLPLGIGAAGQKSKYPSTPEGVVQQFCQLDAEGKRLSGDTLAEITKFVAWEEIGGEVIFIIDSFNVGKATIDGNKASVPVDYRIIGSTDSIQFLEPSPKRMNPYIYKLIRSNGVWKIDAPLSAPHVHWKTAIAHLRLLQKDESPRSKQLESIINEICKARGKFTKTQE